MAKNGRRPNGDGWLFKDGDGYRVKLAVGIDPSTGATKYRSARVKSHEEARKKLRQMQAELQQGRLVPSTKGNLATYLEKWLEQHIRASRSPNTYRQYVWLVRQHITPILGTKRVEDIKRADVKNLIALKAKQTVAPRGPSSETSENLLSRNTLRLIRAVLHAAFEDAIQEGLINLNPASKVELPKAPAKEAVFLKPEEAARLFKAAQEDDLAEFWMFMLTTGTRIGEASGIRWQDIDFKAETVTIRGQLQRIEGQLQYRATTKTNQVRVLPLSSDLAARLRELMGRDMIAYQPDPDGIVFLNPAGRRLDPKYVRTKLMRLCEQAGVQPVSPHKLRHTAATLALSETGDLHAVQKMLGHSQIALTANIYGHAVDASQKRVASAVERVLRGNS